MWTFKSLIQTQKTMHISLVGFYVKKIIKKSYFYHRRIFLYVIFIHWKSFRDFFLSFVWLFDLNIPTVFCGTDLILNNLRCKTVTLNKLIANKHVFSFMIYGIMNTSLWHCHTQRMTKTKKNWKQRFSALLFISKKKRKKVLSPIEHSCVLWHLVLCLNVDIILDTTWYCV